MKSAFWRVFALALIVALVPSMAFAGGEVARSSMAGTNFMNTSADTWILFHRAVDGGGFGEFVSEGYNGASGDEGFGRLVVPVGDYVVGFELNDAATASNLVDYSLNGGAFMRAFTIGELVDDLGVTGLNAFERGQIGNVKVGFAGGFSVGVGLYNNTDEDNEGGFKDSSTGFTVNGSWGNGAPGTQGTVELAGEFTVHSDKYEDSNDSANDEEVSGNHFGVNGRYSVSDDSHLEGAIVMLTSDYDFDGGSDGFTATAFKLNYARDLVEEADRGAVVEVGVAYLATKLEPDGASDIEDTSFTMPSCRFSSWTQISDKWTLFGGVYGSWGTSSSENPNVPSDDSFNGDGFDWTAGLGWNPNDNIGLEFYLLTDNISDFLALGSDTPIVGGIGAHASF